MADRLLMLLVYYRAHVTHKFPGFLFGLHDGNVGAEHEPAGAAAGRHTLSLSKGRVPERRVELRPDEVAELFFNATEQPVNRPGRGQAAYYSGKRKRHTVKCQVVVVRVRKPRGRRPAGAGPHPRRVRVTAVGPAHGGRTHDERAYDAARVVGPPGVPRTGDSGYQGAAGMSVPKKKPRGRDLPPRHRAGNRRLARRRVVAEHGIGKMKVWRIASDRYRGPPRRHTLVYKNVAGLPNLMYA